MASKQIIERKKSFAILRAAVETGWREALEGLRKFLGQEDASLDDLDRLPRALLRRLERLLERLVTADSDSERKKAVLKGRKVDMKSAAGALLRTMTRIRDPVKATYGKRFGEVFPDYPSHLLRYDPDRLLTLARHALAMLKDPNPEVPILEIIKKVLPKDFTLKGLDEILREKIDDLAEKLRLHDEAEGQVQLATAAKCEALTRYNTAFPEVARFFMALYRLSGNPHLAKLLQPAGQEPGLLLSEVKKRRASRAARTAGQKKAVKPTSPPDVEE